MIGARVKGLLTSVGFASLQIAVLAALAALWAATGHPALRLGLPLAALLCASMLTTAWARFPYDRARMGFLLVHAGLPLALLGLLTFRPVLFLGLACLALGGPWMFYLKPLLKAKKESAPRPAWERFTLQGTRILFLATGAAMVVWTPLRPWTLVSWLLLALALHLHHLKAWKGQRAQIAGLAAWGLGLCAYLCLR